MMRRTPMKRGTAQLARTPMKPRAPKQKVKPAPGDYQAPYAKSAQVASNRRDNGRTDQEALDACRDQPCYLTLPGLCLGPYRTDTTVPAHQNEGKGTGIKVPDRFSVPACHPCHYEYDQGKLFTRDQKRGFFYSAYDRWLPVRVARIGR